MNATPQRPVRTILMVLAFLASVAGLALAPGMTQKARAADCTKPEACLHLVSNRTDDGMVLDVDNSQTSEWTNLWAWKRSSGANQLFNLRRFDDGSFQIRTNLNNGMCLGSGDGGPQAVPVGLTHLIVLRTCEDVDSQKFYFQPTSQGRFLIRNLADDGASCLTSHASQWSNPIIGLTQCNGDTDRQWSILDNSYSAGGVESQYNDSRYKQLAAVYGFSRCATDKTYCSWKAVPGGGTTSQESPICKTLDLYKDSGSLAKYVESELAQNSKTVGHSVRKEESLSAKLHVGAGPFSAEIESKFGQSWDESFSETSGHTFTFSKEGDVTTRGPYQYVWLVERPTKEELKGTYRFAPGTFAEWSFDGTITTTVGAARDGVAASNWSGGSSWVPPAACGGFPKGQIPLAGKAKCVDVTGGNTANGTELQIYGCGANQPNQVWTKQSNGLVVAYGKCMGLKGESTANGTPVVLTACNGKATQRWQPYNGGIRNSASEKCLSTRSAALTDGTKLAISPCDGQAGQKFALPK